MGGVKFDIEGIKELNELLTQLPTKVTKNITKGVNFKAAGLAIKVMEEAAPTGSASVKAKEKIKNNILAKSSEGDSVLVGLSRKVFFGTFLSSGTKDRVTKINGFYKKPKSTGKIIGTDWIPKAHQQAFPQIIDYLNKNYLQLIEDSIQRVMKKLLK